MKTMALVGTLVLPLTQTWGQAVEYKFEPTNPGSVEMGGLLGQRLDANIQGRLLRMDEDALLDGFRHRPGKQAWCGEHVGKFLHAGTLAWQYSGDPALREKLDRVVDGLVATQLPDGYLGTYTPDKYWTSWDVWVHKYCLIGLLTYYRATKSEKALAAARKIGDLLCNTFGPGKRDIIKSGTHVGMAATSVLQPMVELYTATNDAKYLDFCRYIVSAYDQPDGPKIIRTLLKTHSVRRTANAKAYEMMSNLVGLCELYQVTGEERLLRAAEIAWQDIHDNQMYVTGGTSLREHFQEPHFLPNTGHVSENCAQVTWLQLNTRLLWLTGEAKYGSVIERVILNHLLASQRPDGAALCYFTPLAGRKPYGTGISCCTSSGPRGIALIPTVAYSRSADGVAVNLYGPSKLKTTLPDGTALALIQETEFPRPGTVKLRVQPEKPTRFTLLLRAPVWLSDGGVSVNGQPADQALKANTYARIRRTWAAGDTVSFDMPAPLRVIVGDYTNQGLACLARGPFIYAFDVEDNPDRTLTKAVALAALDPEELHVRDVAPDPELQDVGPYRIQVDCLGAGPYGDGAKPRRFRGVFRPFAMAGESGSSYSVWLNTPESLGRLEFSLLAAGRESWSREGNVQGSIVDGDTHTWRVTFDGTKREQDWYAVEMDAPVKVSRLIYAHGNSYHDGGWFDATAGKPQFQVQRTKGGPWETVVTLDSYPATTATDNKGLKQGQRFEATIPPTSVYGVRVVGRPACGDSPGQAFSSCAELEAF